MFNGKSTLERAFELAQSGQVGSLEDLRRALKREGYEAVESHLAGAYIKKQLAKLLADAQPAAALPAALARV